MTILRLAAARGSRSPSASGTIAIDATARIDIVVCQLSSQCCLAASKTPRGRSPGVAACKIFSPANPQREGPLAGLRGGTPYLVQPDRAERAAEALTRPDVLFACGLFICGGVGAGLGDLPIL